MARLRLAAPAVAAGLALGLGAAPSEARVFVNFGIGVPLIAPAWYYPPPVVYAPPPVAYVPPPVAYGPAYAQPAQPTWYYCDPARQYYPYVTSCSTQWRAVPAMPAEGAG